MKTKHLNNIHVDLPILAFGGMRLPMNDNQIDVEKTNEMVDFAMANGLNYFDTAYFYHEGKSEIVLGNALSTYERESYFLTDKLPIWGCETPEDMEKVFEDQLKKCNTPYFDFYLLHALSKNHFEKCEKFGAYDFVKQKQKEGKVKYIGFSFHDTPEVLQQIVDAHEWDFAQLQLNYIDWTEQNGKAQYDILEKAGIPCFVMEPVRGGYLAGLADEAERIFKAVNKDASIASWALKWVASLPNVVTVLSGMSNMEQLKDNIATFADFDEMTTEEYAAVEKVLEVLNSLDTVPCTGCRYCMDCPSGVDIPAVFSIYNDYKKTNNAEMAKRRYLKEIEKASHAEKCICCGACEDKCPQQIKISQKLADIHAVLQSL